MGRWLSVARSPAVVRRAIGTTVVVGSILTAINHGDALWRGDVSTERLLRIALTLVVPYCVSTYSAVGALLQRERSEDGSGTTSPAPRPRP